MSEVNGSVDAPVAVDVAVDLPTMGESNADEVVSAVTVTVNADE